MRDIDGILYANDGDWVESLTALVEHADGRLEIIEWAEVMAARSALRLPSAEPVLAFTALSRSDARLGSLSEDTP
jgi:hypothetical protein